MNIFSDTTYVPSYRLPHEPIISFLSNGETANFKSPHYPEETTIGHFKWIFIVRDC